MSRKQSKPKKAKAITAKRVQATEDEPVPQVGEIEPKPEIDDDEPVGHDGLNLRRRAFVEYITGAALNNATKAAELAGYASDNRQSLYQTASRLLSFVKVQEAIAHRLAEHRATNDFILNGVADLAGASMASFVTVGPDGHPEMDWAKAAANGAIGHVKEFREEGFTAGGEKVTIVKRTFKIYDRLKALELLAKMRGMIGVEPQEQERRVQRRAMRIGDDAGNADHN